MSLFVCSSVKMNWSIWKERSEFCRHNALVAGAFLSNYQATQPQQLPHNNMKTLPPDQKCLSELVQVWNLLAISLDTFEASQQRSQLANASISPSSSSLSSPYSSFWMENALGRPLLMQLVNFLRSKSRLTGFHVYRQCLVTFVCIVGLDDFLLLLHGGGEKQIQLPANENVTTTPTTTSVENDERAKKEAKREYLHLLRVYTEVM